MKKLLLLAAIIGFSVNGNSQVVFSENWDGVGPGMAGWTRYNVDGLTPNTNVSYVNNSWVSNAYEFDNNVALSTSWYTPAGTSNDWLVSPSITLPAGTNTLYWDGLAYDPSYPDSYKVYISTTGNAVANFTTVLLDVDPEDSTGFVRQSVDLTPYAGQTIYIAFQNYSSDMYLLALDNIAVINNDTCFAPERDMATTSTTTTSATIEWLGGSGDFDVALGPVGFIPTVATGTANTESYTATGLTPDTRYQFYVRTMCGSNWVGPYSVFTARTLPYDYGFETVGGYAQDGWVGSWSLNTTPANAQAGNQVIFSNTSGVAATANNRSIFSKPLALAAGQTVTVSFWHKETSTSVNRSLRVRVVNEATPLVSTVIYSGTQLKTTTYTQVTTSVFTAATAGTYFIEFNDFSPGSATAASMLLDSIVMTTTLATDNFNEAKFSVYPNPTSNFVNVSNELGAVINTVEMTDMNGRIVKTSKVDATEAQISIADLAAGVYMMKITTDQGVATKKIVRQ